MRTLNLFFLSLLVSAGAHAAPMSKKRAPKAPKAKTQWTCHATGHGVIAMVQFFQATATTREQAEQRVLAECNGAYVCYYADYYKH